MILLFGIQHLLDSYNQKLKNFHHHHKKYYEPKELKNKILEITKKRKKPVD